MMKVVCYLGLHQKQKFPKFNTQRERESHATKVAAAVSDMGFAGKEGRDWREASNLLIAQFFLVLRKKDLLHI